MCAADWVRNLTLKFWLNLQPSKTVFLKELLQSRIGFPSMKEPCRNCFHSRYDDLLIYVYVYVFYVYMYVFYV